MACPIYLLKWPVIMSPANSTQWNTIPLEYIIIVYCSLSLTLNELFSTFVKFTSIKVQINASYRYSVVLKSNFNQFTAYHQMQSPHRKRWTTTNTKKTIENKCETLLPSETKNGKFICKRYTLLKWTQFKPFRTRYRFTLRL